VGNATDGDDIVIREKAAEDVSRYGGNAKEVQNEENDRVRGLIRRHRM
jgi:c-di-AMP phosphodiesterase-like protein